MNKNYLWFALLLVVVGVASFFYNLSQDEVETRQIAALINGEPIYLDDVEKEMGTLTIEQSGLTTRLSVVEFLAEKKLLLQAAKREGITLEDGEVAALYESHPNPDEVMALQNLSQAEFIERLAEQVLITKLFESLADKDVIEAEFVNQIYELNYKDELSFEEAEPLIIDLLLDNSEEIKRKNYIALLKGNAEVNVLI